VVWWENLRERDDLEDLGIDGKIIEKWVLKNRIGGFGLDSLVHYRNQWQAVLSMVMNLQVP
jgi:hypothetical protein